MEPAMLAIQQFGIILKFGKLTLFENLGTSLWMIQNKYKRRADDGTVQY